MRNPSSKPRISLRMLVVTALMSTCIGLSAQGVLKEKNYSDGTRVLRTTEVRYAKSGGVLSASQKVGMSYITFAEDNSSTFAIVMPLNTNHRLIIPTGSRMILYLENGETLELMNVKVIERGDNHTEFDRTYTVRPEYAIDAEKLAILNELQVTNIRIETDAECIDIKKDKYPRSWSFNRMVQRCHDVLVWKLAEEKY